jgi:hypothetical protein
MIAIPMWLLLTLVGVAGAFVGAGAIIVVAIWSDYLDEKAGKK